MVLAMVSTRITYGNPYDETVFMYRTHPRVAYEYVVGKARFFPDGSVMTY